MLFKRLQNTQKNLMQAFADASLPVSKVEVQLDSYGRFFEAELSRSIKVDEVGNLPLEFDGVRVKYHNAQPVQLAEAGVPYFVRAEVVPSSSSRRVVDKAFRALGLKKF